MLVAFVKWALTYYFSITINFEKETKNIQVNHEYPCR